MDRTWSSEIRTILSHLNSVFLSASLLGINICCCFHMTTAWSYSMNTLIHLHEAHPQKHRHIQVKHLAAVLEGTAAPTGQVTSHGALLRSAPATLNPHYLLPVTFQLPKLPEGTPSPCDAEGAQCSTNFLSQPHTFYYSAANTLKYFGCISTRICEQRD